MHPSAVAAALVLLLVPGCTLLPSGEESGNSDFSNAGVPPLPSVEDMPPMDSSGNSQELQYEFRCRFTSSRDYHDIEPNDTNEPDNPGYDPADGEERTPSNSIPMKVGDRDLIRYEFEMYNHGHFDSVWLDITDGFDVVSGDTRADGPFPEGKHTVILELQVEATKPGNLGMWGYFHWNLSDENGSFCRSLSYGVTE